MSPNGLPSVIPSALSQDIHTKKSLGFLCAPLGHSLLEVLLLQCPDAPGHASLGSYFSFAVRVLTRHFDGM